MNDWEIREEDEGVEISEGIEGGYGGKKGRIRRK